MRPRPDGKGCHARCLHRVLVEGYRDARHAWEALRESDTPVPAAYAGGATTTCMQLEDDEFRAAYPPPTFKQWLIDHSAAERVVTLPDLTDPELEETA